MSSLQTADIARKKYVIGNWKMHGSKQQLRDFFASWETKVASAAKAQAKQSMQLTVGLCPPYVYLEQAAALCAASQLKSYGIFLGAQDLSDQPGGAYTGQVSAQMLSELGCQYVIIGHSERRQYCHESNALIAQKCLQAKAAGLIPVICIGETQAQRVAELTATVVSNQLSDLIAVQKDLLQGCILAYEPIWAIGTGLSASPEQAQQVHSLLRRTLAEYDAALARLPILYGGSVKGNNAKALFAMPDIDGALVGGAALQAEDFWAICETLA